MLDVSSYIAAASIAVAASVSAYHEHAFIDDLSQRCKSAGGVVSVIDANGAKGVGCRGSLQLIERIPHTPPSVTSG